MINLIVAVSKNNVIGKKNTLPWYYPEDLKYFKAITTGKTVIMGRLTFDSIISRNNKILPNRKNVVVTRNKDFLFDDVIVVHNLKEYLKNSKDKEIFIMGGKQIYEESMEFIDKFYITHIKEAYDGDVVLNIDYSKIKKTSSKMTDQLEFAIYERRI